MGEGWAELRKGEGRSIRDGGRMVRNEERRRMELKCWEERMVRMGERRRKGCLRWE
jgi:hypothetical protein